MMIDRMRFLIGLLSGWLLNSSRTIEVEARKILCHRWSFNWPIKIDQRVGMRSMFNVCYMIIADGTIKIERHNCWEW